MNWCNKFPINMNEQDPSSRSCDSTNDSATLYARPTNPHFKTRGVAFACWWSGVEKV